LTASDPRPTSTSEVTQILKQTNPRTMGSSEMAATPKSEKFSNKSISFGAKAGLLLLLAAQNVRQFRDSTQLSSVINELFLISLPTLRACLLCALDGHA